MSAVSSQEIELETSNRKISEKIPKYLEIKQHLIK